MDGEAWRIEDATSDVRIGNFGTIDMKPLGFQCESSEQLM